MFNTSNKLSTKALHTVIVIKYLIEIQVGTSFSQK